MLIDRHRAEPLTRKAHPNHARPHREISQRCQQPVIKPAAPTQPVASPIKGKTRDEQNARFTNLNAWARSAGLKHPASIGDQFALRVADKRKLDRLCRFIKPRDRQTPRRGERPDRTADIRLGIQRPERRDNARGARKKQRDPAADLDGCSLASVHGQAGDQFPGLRADNRLGIRLGHVWKSTGNPASAAHLGAHPARLASGVVPFTTPPVYPPCPPGKFAAAIQRSSADLLDRPLAAPDVSKCSVAILGLADDTGVAMNHGRTGARDGPAAFRAALARYGVAARIGEARVGESAFRSDWGSAAGVGSAGGGGFGLRPYPHVFDAGDIVPGKSLSETHERVTTAAVKLMEHGLIVVGIGGGHDLTYPLVRALHQFRRNASTKDARPLVGLYADAHLDVRPEPGSGMAFRAMIEHGYVKRLVNIGASWAVNSAEHTEWFASHGGVFDTSSGALEQLRSRGRELPWPDFVSLDIDVLDASVAPGVSAINPAGMHTPELAAVAFAAGACPQVRLIDLMEFNPNYDIDHRTARVVAHLFLSFLAGVAERRS